MQNGSGDDLDAIFSSTGCLIRGFAHEYPMSPYASDPPKLFPGVLDNVPTYFRDAMAALDPDWWTRVTFCIWRRHSDQCWHHGNIAFPEGDDPDGSEFLLSAFDGRPETYWRWAEQYYSRKVDFGSVKRVFNHQPLTFELVRALNPDRSWQELLSEAQQIGYPIPRD
jgi:hypothetical protein